MTHFKLAFASVLVAFMAVLALAWHRLSFDDEV